MKTSIIIFFVLASFGCSQFDFTANENAILCSKFNIGSFTNIHQLSNKIYLIIDQKENHFYLSLYTLDLCVQFLDSIIKKRDEEFKSIINSNNGFLFLSKNETGIRIIKFNDSFKIINDTLFSFKENSDITCSENTKYFCIHSIYNSDSGKHVNSLVYDNEMNFQYMIDTNFCEFKDIIFQRQIKKDFTTYDDPKSPFFISHSRFKVNDTNAINFINRELNYQGEILPFVFSKIPYFLENIDSSMCYIKYKDLAKDTIAYFIIKDTSVFKYRDTAEYYNILMPVIDNDGNIYFGFKKRKLIEYNFSYYPKFNIPLELFLFKVNRKEIKKSNKIKYPWVYLDGWADFYHPMSYFQNRIYVHNSNIYFIDFIIHNDSTIIYYNCFNNDLYPFKETIMKSNLSKYFYTYNQNRPFYIIPSRGDMLYMNSLSFINKDLILSFDIIDYNFESQSTPSISYYDPYTKTTHRTTSISYDLSTINFKKTFFISFDSILNYNYYNEIIKSQSNYKLFQKYTGFDLFHFSLVNEIFYQKMIKSNVKAIDDHLRILYRDKEGYYSTELDSNGNLYNSFLVLNCWNENEKMVFLDKIFYPYKNSILFITGKNDIVHLKFEKKD